MPDPTPPPRSPIREYVDLTSTLAELRSIVADTADWHPGCPVRVRIARSGGTAVGSPLAALAVANVVPAEPTDSQ